MPLVSMLQTRSLRMFVLKGSTVEPLYNEVLGIMKITMLYQVSGPNSLYFFVFYPDIPYQGKKQRNIKSWDQQNDLVIRGFCYIRPLYNEFSL